MVDFFSIKFFITLLLICILDVYHFCYGSLVKTFNVVENIDNLCENLPK